MSSTPPNVDDFESLQWARPYVSAPNWVIQERIRGTSGDIESDIFPSQTMRSYGGVQHWVEMYEKPAPGSSEVKKAISMCKFGTGLGGFIGICHGGASMALMDEALGFAMIANENERLGNWANTSSDWKKAFDDGKPPSEALKGFMVTAKLDMKFLKPVLCPGVVGIEVDVLENKGHKMKLRGIMKDANGTPLLQADGLWVRLGGASKL